MNEDKREANRKIAERIFEQAWNQVDFDGLEDLIVPDAQFHIRNHTLPTNAQDLQRTVAAWHTAFPDFHFAVEEMVPEHDLVAVRLTLSETHASPWQALPATGKHMRVTAVLLLRFNQGQVVEIWADYDESGRRNQLGQDEG